MTDSDFSQHILQWFNDHGRKNLPWQHNRTPYRVWVSEIMLQQTQVTTVIPYYERFMARFPTVEQLAEASQDDVISYWAGLGYYARGRNLHKCAQAVVNDDQGEFPRSIDELQNLPGIGRSTAGAIISLSSGKRAVILDGNVKRVLARYQAVDGWPGKTSVANTLWEYAERYTPDKRCDDYNQAMMDLGATLCSRSKPGCNQCPVHSNCQAFALQRQTDFPGKKPKKTLPVKTVQWLVMRNTQGAFFMEHRPPQGIWGGLWSFPEMQAEESVETKSIQYGDPINTETLDSFRHTFSHYHLDIHPTLIHLEELPLAVNDDSQQWFNQEQLTAVGLAAPVKKLLKSL